VARGWESKNVEAQQADREQSASAKAGPVSAEEAAKQARRKTLELTRSRALADLATARTAAHRQMLEAAIRTLDEQLKNLT
jgi:hypothetical protein